MGLASDHLSCDRTPVTFITCFHQLKMLLFNFHSMTCLFALQSNSSSNAGDAKADRWWEMLSERWTSNWRKRMERAKQIDAKENQNEFQSQNRKRTEKMLSYSTWVTYNLSGWLVGCSLLTVSRITHYVFDGFNLTKCKSKASWTLQTDQTMIARRIQTKIDLKHLADPDEPQSESCLLDSVQRNSRKIPKIFSMV